jgi:superfamily I DNA and RNA helicase
VVITASPEQTSLFVHHAAGSRDEVFRVMDRQQERFAKGLGSGHRVIRGVAGSGKTLILVARARLLSRLLPGQRILVTCYTRSLASVLRAQLADCDNVHVEHIDSLFAKAIKGAGLEHPGFRRKVTPSSVAVQALELRMMEQYRAVLVDEAQDLDTDALRFCVQLTQPNGDEDGDLLIVADSAQNIFRRKFSWSDAGIKAQGRTSILRKNYRNTKEILAFAQDFLVADAEVASDELPELDDELTIIPPDAAERSGPEPTVEVVTDLEAEVERVVAEVSSRYASNLPARSIAVLMVDHSGDDRGRRIVDRLTSQHLPTYWVTDPSHATNKDRAGTVDEPIIVSTVHSAKGLEFPSVIMCGLGGRSGKQADNVTARKTVYVGFTRALDELSVVTTADNVFAGDLRREGSVDGRSGGA